MIQSPNLSRLCRRWGPPLAVTAVLLGGLGACDSAPPEITGMTPDSAFVAVVVPVLEEQCEGCHFAGGPMYKKMPFDDLEVVRSLEDALVSRLEGKGQERVAEWLTLVRNARSASEASVP